MSENKLSDEAIAFIKECYVNLNQSRKGVWSYADLPDSVWNPKLHNKNKQVFFNIIHDAIAYEIIDFKEVDTLLRLKEDFLSFYSGFLGQVGSAEGYTRMLEKRVVELENRFGLVWKEQEEQFLKIINEEEIVIGTALFKLNKNYEFLSETKDKKIKKIKSLNGEVFEISRKRGDSFLYFSKELQNLFVLYSVNGKVNVYSFDNNHYLKYFPVLKSKGDSFGFGEIKDNLLIEGDNYYVLQLLQFTHKNKIDVIYIDPPYNTGNGDFKYNDAFVGSDDGSRHSKWLSFMEKRLKLAKELLSDSGAIFISIDDYEHSYLKLLCDRIFFGFSDAVFIQEKGNAQNDAKIVQKNHEYLVCYTNSKHFIQKIKEEIKVHSDNNGFFVKTGLVMGGGEGGTLNGRPNLAYTIYFNEKSKLIIPKLDLNLDIAKTSNNYEDVYIVDEKLIKSGFVAINPPLNGNKIGCWKWGIEKFKENIDKIIIEKNKKSYSVYRKDYKFGKKITENRLLVTREGAPKSILNYSNNQGTLVLKKVFGGSKLFNNPKSVELLKFILSLKESNVVLDFFAGSGTTGQAVLELNKEDGGNRKYILCTNNENNICEDVTYERMKRLNDPKSYNLEIDALPHGLKYLQIKHISEADLEDFDAMGDFDNIKEITNIKFNATKTIVDTNDYYITDKYAVLKLKGREQKTKCFEDFAKISFENGIKDLILLSNNDLDFILFKETIQNIHLTDFNYSHMSKDYVRNMISVVNGEMEVDLEEHKQDSEEEDI